MGRGFERVWGFIFALTEAKSRSGLLDYRLHYRRGLVLHSTANRIHENKGVRAGHIAADAALAQMTAVYASFVRGVYAFQRIMHCKRSFQSALCSLTVMDSISARNLQVLRGVEKGRARVCKYPGEKGGGKPLCGAVFLCFEAGAYSGLAMHFCRPKLCWRFGRRWRKQEGRA